MASLFRLFQVSLLRPRWQSLIKGRCDPCSRADSRPQRDVKNAGILVSEISLRYPNPPVCGVECPSASSVLRNCKTVIPKSENRVSRFMHDVRLVLLDTTIH